MIAEFRKYTNNILVKLLMGILVVSFLIWGIGDVIRAASKDYVAVVAGDQYISVTDFLDAKKKQVQQLRAVYPNITADQIKALNINDIVINQLVTGKLLQVEASKLGIEIDDKIALDAITRTPSFMNEKGVFDPELFKKVIAYNGIPEREYVDQIKTDFAQKMLLDSLKISLNPSRLLVDAVDNYNNQTAKITLYELALNKLKVKKPTEAEVEKYYHDNIIKFTTKEYRDVEYIEILPEFYKTKVKVSDQELREEMSQALVNQSEQVGFDYYDVLFESEEEANKVLELIAKKESFDKAVKDVTGEDVIQYLIKDQRLNVKQSEIGKILSELKVGGVSNVIKNDIGFHILKLIKENKNSQDIAKVENEIKQHILQQKIEEVMYSDIKNIEDELASGKSLSEIAHDYGFALRRIESVSDQGIGRNDKKIAIPEHTDFLVEAFKLPENQPSELLNIDDTKAGYYIVSSSKIYPAKEVPFEQVKSKAEANIIEQNEAIEAQKIMANLKADITKLNQYPDIIQKKELDLTRPNDTATNNGQIVPRNISAAIFESQPGSSSTVFALDNGNYAFAILQKLENAKKPSSDDDLKGLAKGIAYNMSSDVMQQYMSYLGQKYKVEIHSDILHQLED